MSGGILNSSFASLSFSSALALYLTAALQILHQLPQQYSPSPFKANSALGFNTFSAHSFSSMESLEILFPLFHSCSEDGLYFS